MRLRQPPLSLSVRCHNVGYSNLQVLKPFPMVCAKLLFKAAAAAWLKSEVLLMHSTDWQLLLIAITGAPVIFAFIAIALAWRSISHRALFAVMAFLSLWGISAIVYPIAQGIINPPLLSSAAYPSPLFNVLAITAASVGLLGFPALWWLRNVLRAT